MATELKRRVPRLTIGDRRRFLKTRIIATEGERDRVEAELGSLRRDLYAASRGKTTPDAQVVALVEAIRAVEKRWSELNTELGGLQHDYHMMESNQ